MRSKNIQWLRLIPLLILMLFVALILPAFPVLAATEASGVSVTGITATYDNSGDHTLNGNNTSVTNDIYMKVNAGTIGTKYIKLYLTAQEDGKLTFTYNVTSSGSFYIQDPNGNKVTTASGTNVSYELTKGQAVTIYLEAKSSFFSSSKKDGVMTVTGISFEPANALSVYFNPPAMSGVSYTVNGTSVSSANTEVKLSSETSMAAVFSGIPSGYTVREWTLSDGTPYTAVSSNMLTLTRPSESITLTPVIEKAGVPIFKVGTTRYYSWEEAFTAAGETGTVILYGDGALPTTVDEDGTYAKNVDGKAVYTIGAGQTLLLPRIEGQTASDIKDASAKYPHANYATFQDDSRWIMNPDTNRYLQLTIPSGVTVNNNGRMVLGGTVASKIAYFSGGTLSQSTVAGHTHSDIVLNGTLNMGDNAILSSIGFITGVGTLNATGSGAEIYQPFVVADYRGGNYAVGAAGKYGEIDYSVDTGSGEEIISPFLRYTMQNIQTTINLYAGNYMYGYADLYADDAHNLTTACIIGDSSHSGLVNLAENASVTAKYQNTNKVNHYDAFVNGSVSDGTRGGIEGWGYNQIGRTKLEIFGGASLGSLELIVEYSGNQIPMSMSNVTFPVPYNFDIYLNSGTYDISYSMMLLPGASMTVNADAMLNIGGSGNRFMVMDGLFDHTLCGDRTSQTSKYEYTTDFTYPKTGELQTAGLSGTAELKLNGGTLIVNDGVKFGGLVQTDGTTGSQVTFNGTSGCDIRIGLVGSNSLWYQWAGATTRTLPARLMSGAGQYVSMQAGKTYKGAADSDNTINSYTFDLYTSSSDKSAKTSYTEVSGKVCDNCATCQLKYGSEKARCVCNIFSPIAVSGMWYEYTLTVKEADKADVVYYYLDGKLYTANGEVTTHTISDGCGATVASGSGVTVSTDGETTLTFSNIALTEDTVVEITPACTHANMEETAQVDAGCESDGTKSYWTCKDCGRHYVDESRSARIMDLAAWKTGDGKIPATNHKDENNDHICENSCGGAISTCKENAVHTAAKAATCDATGNLDYWTCSVCGKHYKNAECTEEYEENEWVVDENSNNHANVVTDAAVDPQCEATGLTEGSHCEACGEVLVAQEVVDALGHTEGAVVVENEVAATCTADGSYDNVVYCTVCKVALSRETVTEKATGHSYESTVTAPTCTEAGYTTYTCACGDTYTANEVDALGHSFTNYVSDNNATCTEDGTKTAKCDRCDVTDTKTDVESALGHDYKAVVTEPTCLAGGYTTYTCSRCSDSYVDSSVAALGHSFTNYVSDNNATCTEDGTKTAKCDRCDASDTLTDEESALGHKETEIPAVAPTCTETGLTAGTKCLTCGEILTAQTEVPAKGHTVVIDEAVAADCVNTGLTEGKHCSVCGEVLVAQTEVAALGHKYDAVVTAPTCTEEGYTTYTCHCGDTYVADEVAALGHDYKETVTAPTFEKDGYTTYTCSVCNDSYEEIAEGTKLIAVAQIGEQKYQTLAEAITKVQAGQTIKLLADVTISESYILIPENVTLDFNSFTVTGTVLGKLSMNNGTLVTAEGYKMVGPEANYYQTTDAVMILSIGETLDPSLCDVDLLSGTLTVVQDEWWTGVGQKMIIREGATFEIPEGKKMQVRCTVIVEGTVKVDGIVNLYEKDASIAYAGELGEHITTTAGDKIMYVDGKYIVHDHTEAIDAAVAPTCTATGKTEGKHCSVCGDVLVAQEVVDALGHTPAAAVEENRVESTCTVAGSYESVVYCSVCNAELSRETKALELAAHTPAAAVEENRVESTCTVAGSYDEVVYCSECDEELSRTPKALELAAHTEGAVVVKNKVDATCTAEGSYDNVVYCTVCDAELSRDTVTMEKLAHTPAEAVEEKRIDSTCTVAGSYDEVVYCSVCSEQISRETTELELADHTPAAAVEENRIESTCTVAGSYDEVVYCSACNEELSRESKALELAAHTEVILSAQPATCTAKGKTEGLGCSVCNAVLVAQEEISATGHSMQQVSAAIAPSCETTGATAILSCKNGCGTTEGGEPISALGHNYDEGVITTEPTCTNAGVKTFTCGSCGDTKTESIEATGHSYNDGVITTEPSCTSDGVKTFTCSCGDSYTETISAAGHTVVIDQAVAPTCTATGLTEGSHCGTCGEVLVAQTVVNVTEHSYVDGECTVCGAKDPDAEQFIPEIGYGSTTVVTTEVNETTGTVVTTFKAGSNVNVAPTVTITSPEGGWKLGENTFTVSSGEEDIACVVIVKVGDTFTRLPVTTTDGVHSFTGTLAEGCEIIVAIKGDADGNGAITTSDYIAIARSLLQPDNGRYMALGSLYSIIGDADGNGSITTADYIAIARALLQPSNTRYQSIVW